MSHNAVNNGEKKRFNIAMSDAVRDRATKMADRDRRSFSNLLEVLIDREYDRLAKKAKRLADQRQRRAELRVLRKAKDEMAA